MPLSLSVAWRLGPVKLRDIAAYPTFVGMSD
jgi:hypothetical protein